MPEQRFVSEIQLPDGVVAEVKDTVARAAAAGTTHFIGVSTTPLADGSTVTTIVVNGHDVTVVNGDIAVYGNKEFIYATIDLKWHEMGDITGLGALALKDSVTASYQPAGTVSTPTITVTPSKANKYMPSNATGGGSVTPGTAAQATMPVLSMTVDDDTLVLEWTAGSFTANTPTAVTLPSFTQQEVVVGISSASSSQPTFEGTAATILSQ